MHKKFYSVQNLRNINYIYWIESARKVKKFYTCCCIRFACMRRASSLVFIEICEWLKVDYGINKEESYCTVTIRSSTYSLAKRIHLWPQVLSVFWVIVCITLVYSFVIIITEFFPILLEIWVAMFEDISSLNSWRRNQYECIEKRYRKALGKGLNSQDPAIWIARALGLFLLILVCLICF